MNTAGIAKAHLVRKRDELRAQADALDSVIAGLDGAGAAAPAKTGRKRKGSSDRMKAAHAALAKKRAAKKAAAAEAAEDASGNPAPPRRVANANTATSGASLAEAAS